MGEVHDGTAIMDLIEEEQERGITITSAATTYVLERQAPQPHRHARPRRLHRRSRAFAARARRRGRVFDGKEGVEAQSETVWRQATSTKSRASSSSTRWTRSARTSTSGFNSILERSAHRRSRCRSRSGRARPVRRHHRSDPSGRDLLLQPERAKDKGKTQIEADPRRGKGSARSWRPLR